MASNGAVLEDIVDAWGEDMSATDEDSDTRRLLSEQAAPTAMAPLPAGEYGSIRRAQTPLVSLEPAV
ncbi:hypothetical protein GBAR_LOCUS28001 [Geodia barretti]|uniref:Uncharacterized protein n=1 Tax=Geodia barretti TaxID=519541 RepID=A0AA35TNW1_GEOBA|nr:hypothetical protein GBAR_LOCUS28001 [Geodia barretti]